MKEHFMCAHTFLSEEDQKAFEEGSLNMTDWENFARMKK
tara:strand:+ start:1305 stop:1421 length:117 start_codon:yes stop_codon:yes gene_type:complete